MQLDRVLSALQLQHPRQPADAAAGLRLVAQRTSRRPAQDATQDPTQRGLTAAQSLNQNLNYAAGAFKASTIVNAALLGRAAARPVRVVTGTGHVFGALASQQNHLAHLVGSFNATMAALAARQDDLSETIALLPPLLRTANNALGPIAGIVRPHPDLRA